MLIKKLTFDHTQLALMSTIEVTVSTVEATSVNISVTDVKHDER
jgi:hypothetical protein